MVTSLKSYIEAYISTIDILLLYLCKSLVLDVQDYLPSMESFLVSLLHLNIKSVESVFCMFCNTRHLDSTKPITIDTYKPSSKNLISIPKSQKLHG